MAGPYRDDTAALSDRLAHVRDELESVRERTRELESLQKAEKDLSREAEVLTKKLDARRALPLLESIHIASPCSAKWDDMVGDDRVRFCGHCEKNVYNIAGMSRAEAEGLLTSGSPVCVRLFRRADGTVLTQDCPVGVRRKRRRRVLAAVAVGGGLAASTAGFGFTRMGAVEPPPARMGQVEMGGPAPSLIMGEMTAPEPAANPAPSTTPEAQSASSLKGNLPPKVSMPSQRARAKAPARR